MRGYGFKVVPDGSGYAVLDVYADVVVHRADTNADAWDAVVALSRARNA